MMVITMKINLKVVRKIPNQILYRNYLLLIVIILITKMNVKNVLKIILFITQKKNV